MLKAGWLIFSSSATWEKFLTRARRRAYSICLAFKGPTVLPFGYLIYKIAFIANNCKRAAENFLYLLDIHAPA